MIIRTDQAGIDKYFEDKEHLSQSLIKALLKGVEVFNKEEEGLYYEEKEHFNVGDGVDVLLTQGDESFSNKFAVLTVDKPGQKLMSVVHKIFDKYIVEKEINEIRTSNLRTNVTKDIIVNSAREEQFQNKWKDDTLVNNITNEAGDYFDSMCINHGKQLLSPEEMQTINAISDSLKTNSLTSWLFPDANSVPAHIHIAYQVPIYFDYMGEKCKALLDIVVIDDEKKTVTPYDLKTLGDYTINFKTQMMRMRYDIQAAFYTVALRNGLQNKSIFGNIEGTYTIESFRFIVESAKQQGNPLIYVVDDELHSMGLFGRTDGYSRIYPQTDEIPFPDKVYHQPIYGIVDGIELYKWHTENGFDKDKIVVENEGIINLAWNKIY